METKEGGKEMKEFNKIKDQSMGIRLSDDEYNYIRKNYGTLRFFFERVVLGTERPIDFTPSGQNRKIRRRRSQALYNKPSVSKIKIPLPPIGRD